MLCLLFPPRFWGVPKGNGGGLFGENGLPTRNNRRDIMELSRRDLFKFGGIAAVGAAGAGMLAGCSPSGGSSKGAPAAASKDTDGLPSFFQAPEPIKDVTETKEFDVVVIGAGAAGVPCALAAADAGAKVAQQVKPDCCQRDRQARNGIIMVQQRAYDDHYHNNLNQGFGGYFHVRNFPGRQWVEFPARLSFRQRNVGVKNIERQSYNKNLFIALSK